MSIKLYMCEKCGEEIDPCALVINEELPVPNMCPAKNNEKANWEESDHIQTRKKPQ